MGHALHGSRLQTPPGRFACTKHERRACPAYSTMHYIGTLLTSLQPVQRPSAADRRPLSLAAFRLSRAHPSPSTTGRCCRPFPQINPIILWPHRHPSPSHQPSIPSIPTIRSTARKLAAPVPESLCPPILLIGAASIASLVRLVESS